MTVKKCITRFGECIANVAGWVIAFSWLDCLECKCLYHWLILIEVIKRYIFEDGNLISLNTEDKNVNDFWFKFVKLIGKKADWYLIPLILI